MKSRPILFSAAMVRAILDGSKTQTRRVVKNGLSFDPNDHSGQTLSGKSCAQEAMEQVIAGCPYGQPGDRLWIRETFVEAEMDASSPEQCLYRADDNFGVEDISEARWKPSIHMPRWACRIELEIVSVRVERLQEISEEDAIAEGVSPVNSARGEDDIATGNFPTATPWPVRRYALLWNSINGDTNAWESNPYVWVVEFRRIQP